MKVAEVLFEAARFCLFVLAGACFVIGGSMYADEVALGWGHPAVYIGALCLWLGARGVTLFVRFLDAAASAPAEEK